MPFPTLPSAPSRNDPATFSDRADALLAALPAWTDAANALEQSLQLVATTGTSTTTLTVGAGSQSLVASTGRAWVVGAYVYLVSSTSLADRMVGQITAYDSATGALDVDVQTVAGTGSHASWIIGLATSTATASDVTVADAGGYFLASSVETVLQEIGAYLGAIPWANLTGVPTTMLVQSGSIIDWPSETPPAGWLECDGSSLLRASYPALFAVCGTAHGAADALHFNIPDHRGKYKRGWDHGTGNDPDAAARTAAAPGGATGDHVGTTQGWQVQSQTFKVLVTSADGGLKSLDDPIANGFAGASGTTAVYRTAPGGLPASPLITAPGGNQTNSINAAVMSIIKI